MKSLYLMFILLFLETIDARTVRKAPAFAMPKYSDSYIPAVMQVIFNGVEQYKSKQMEETEQGTTSTTIPTTIPHSPGQHQPTPIMLMNELSSTQGPPLAQEAIENATEKPSDNIESTSLIPDEKPEVSAETPESIYGTPETNHEAPEEIHEMPEINQEMPQIAENNHETSDVNSNDKLETSTVLLDLKPEQDNQSNSSSEDSSSSSSSSSEENKNDNNKNNKEPSVDSVVEEIYEIIKPKNKTKNSSEDSSHSGESDESSDDSSTEDDNDENRFTLLGEKVTQVPRPSLTTYLRRSKLPSNCTTLQHLALLYDSLSKDARKQGFAQYAGYSDGVLKTLQTSAEGGMGPQLEILLSKIVERNEVTRADTKTRVRETLEYLKDPSSELNRDLRILLPLRFNS